MKAQIDVALRVISGFRREVAKKCALLGCYAAGSGNSLPTFRDNLLVPFSVFKNRKKACNPNAEFVWGTVWAVVPNVGRKLPLIAA